MIIGINNVFSSIQTNKVSTNRISSPNFSSLKPLEDDKFELSSSREVKLRNMSGEEVNAQITKGKFLDNKIMYTIKAANKTLGAATLENSSTNNDIYLARLYTEPHSQRTYKGAGTELLKSAVIESKKQGCDGKMHTYAANGIHTPFAFYYKNNFILKQGDPRNALIQYAIENQIPVNKVLPEYKCQGIMYLDKESSNALLNGKRLYKDRNYEKAIARTVIDNVEYTADFMQSPYKNEYFLVVTDDSNLKYDNCVITLEEHENEEGKKHFVIKQVTDDFYDEKLTDFEVEIIDKIAETKGYDKTTISENTIPIEKTWYKKYNDNLQTK